MNSTSKKYSLFLLLAFNFVLITNTIKSQTPQGSNLLSNGLNSFSLHGATSPNSIVEEISLSGQTFSKAFRINTFNTKLGVNTLELITNITTPLHKDDVLWISFKSRCLESKRETGEASFEIRFDQLMNGKYLWPPHFERGVSFGKEWTETSVPFVMTKDVNPEDVRLVISLDDYPQRFEISPVTFINCGSDAKMTDLPRTTVRYEGSDPNAAWRKTASENISKYRKGDLAVKVIDAKGKPVKDAEVKVSMTRNAFNWGTAADSRLLLDTVNLSSKMYRDTLLRYFNQVVLENEMKWPAWTDPTNTHEKTLKGIAWLKAHGIAVRGHVMVWPSYQHSPKILADLKNDTAAMRALILKHIEEQTTKMRGQFAEWDVVNEPYAHNDFLKLLGRDAMVDWFKCARAGEPDAKLFLNDYTMFHGEGANSASEKFYDNVKFLIDNGAPIDAIGEQGHIGGTPPGIPKVIERLNYFAGLGLPIQISEFDINSNDDDLKARYMSDFMTAVYSNPATIGFVQWGFWENMHWFPIAALWNKDWSLRKNGKVFTDLVTKTWWTNFTGKTSTDGVCKVRGFCGNYEVTIKMNGKTVTKTYTLDNKGGVLNIEL